VFEAHELLDPRGEGSAARRVEREMRKEKRARGDFKGGLTPTVKISMM
jgi:hypothetical protein